MFWQLLYRCLMSISVGIREPASTGKNPKRQNLEEFGCLWSGTQTEPGHLGPTAGGILLLKKNLKELD